MQLTYERPVMRLLLPALLVCAACDGGSSGNADAGMDAERRLAVTVEGPAPVQGTRSLKVTIEASGIARSDTFPIAGLPATVDLQAPIQLTDWMIQVDGFDMSSQLLGRGTSTVPAGTSETTVTLSPL